MKIHTSNHIQSFESSESFPSFKSSKSFKSSESSKSSKSLTLSNVIKFDSIKSTKTSIQRFENKMKVFNSIICWSSMMMIMMIVMVKAFNSPPVFDFKREIFVPENTPVGQMVSMVRTIDKENDIITYGLDPAHWNDGSKYFRIDEKTGQIFLRESLNGQGGNFLNMYIKANDGHQTAKIEAVISVSKANDKGHIVHYPDVHSPSSSSASSASSSQIYNVNNIFNKSLIPPPPPPPKDIPLESLSKPKQTSSRRPRPPISKVNTFTTNKSKLQQQQQQQQQQNQQSNNDTLKTLKSDQSQQSKISIESNNVRNDNDDDDDIRLINQPKSFELFDLLWPIGPYILISIFVPTLCLLFWCWIHKRNMPSRNAIKTFSHKIISNNNNNNNNNASNKSDNQSIETTTNSFTGDFDCLSPFNKTNSILKYHETSNDNFNVNNYFISSQSSATPNRWEYPRHHLRFMHIVGQGCFGQVWKCELINNNNHNNTNQIVAVKTLKENVSEKEKRNLLDELEVMKILDPHPNVVTLIGCCTERDPVYLIMEYVPLGKLQKYLLDNREDLTFNNSNNNNGGYSKQSTNNNNNRIESQDLISFAYQIAKGMEYLSSKGIIHRDLAARNILVGHNKICKIADFGLAKYNQEIYERKSEGRLPIRWMAIESLKDFIFTTKSDVWSFGILMWEIVTLGCTPYPGWTASEVIKRVNEGYRLEKPEHCKREMYNIMYYCWDRNPHHRPSFSELVCLLDNLFGADDEYIELDRFPDHCYYNLLKPPGCNSNNSGEKL